MPILANRGSGDPLRNRRSTDDAMAGVGLRADPCLRCGALNLRRATDPPIVGCRCPRCGAGALLPPR
jgi:hypothetical protein